MTRRDRGEGVPRPRRGEGVPRPRRGFTLLEVMVALAVLALALSAASDVVGGALRNHVRARQLEVATMLARGRLAEVEARFEEEGFRDSDQSEAGTFDDEGHPEVTWKLEVVKPQVELGADDVLRALTGIEGGVAGLLGLDAKGQPLGGAAGGGASAPTVSLAGTPMAAMAMGLIQQQLVSLAEQLKAGLRELRLTIAWKDGAVSESFTVVTHQMVLQTGAQRRLARQVPVIPPIQPPGPLPGTPPPPPGGRR